ncbi:MAG: sigma-70 family RNA polymerase sigma factor [Clostridiales bacterium]|nr:sigma-70 family RNA polymerase sigma factor [Clostridiales bacterium]
MTANTNDKLVKQLQAIEKDTPQAKAVLSELWEQNEKLIDYFIHKFTGLNKEESGFEDMKQQSYIGFYKAAYTFDASKEITFSTYAAYYIRAEIYRYYNNNSNSIRIPVCMQARIRNSLKIKTEIEAEEGSNITHREALQSLGLSEEKVNNTLTAIQAAKTFSIYIGTTGEESDDRPLVEMLSSGYNLEKSVVDQVWLNELRTYLYKSIKGLSKPRQFIITRYYFGNMPFSEIGVKLGISKQAVHCALNNALAELRRCKYSRILAEFLPADGMERAYKLLNAEMKENAEIKAQKAAQKAKKAETIREETAALFAGMNIDEYSRGLLVV